MTGNQDVETDRISGALFMALARADIRTVEALGRDIRAAALLKDDESVRISAGILSDNVRSFRRLMDQYFGPMARATQTSEPETR